MRLFLHTLRRRTILSDPFFYVVMGAIGMTYVLLILLMLIADTTYIFTSDMSKSVALGFSVDGAGDVLPAGAVVTDSFVRPYGLTVEASEGQQVVVLNSTEPAADEMDFGTPHVSFGGPGVGDGGASQRGNNAVPLGNLLALQSASGGTIRFRWEDPVTLDEVVLVDVDEDHAVLKTFDLNGDELSAEPIPNLGDNSVQTVKVRQSGVALLEIQVNGDVAVAELGFTWLGRVRQPWEREYPRLARCIYNPMTVALGKPAIRYSIKLSLLSCTITAILSLWVAIPIGYLMSRHRFWGRNFVDAVLDIPIVLPPLVVGLSLLILFQFFPVGMRERVVYEIPAVILAQFAVACAFAVRTMRATFDQIDARREQVALTLGCSRGQAFWLIVLPEAGRGVMTAGTLAWARALGEFGPLLIFAGATRMKTEVLSTTVFLELSVGDLGAAVAVSLIMVLSAIVVLVLARIWGTRKLAI
mgnify:CR=1 FL=1